MLCFWRKLHNTATSQGSEFDGGIKELLCNLFSIVVVRVRRSFGEIGSSVETAVEFIKKYLVAVSSV